jgi:hypothetical protein
MVGCKMQFHPYSAAGAESPKEDYLYGTGWRKFRGVNAVRLVSKAKNIL